MSFITLGVACCVKRKKEKRVTLSDVPRRSQNLETGSQIYSFSQSSIGCFFYWYSNGETRRRVQWINDIFWNRSWSVLYLVETLLTLTSNCLQGSLQKWNCCSQNGEPAFAFPSRILPFRSDSYEVCFFS